MSGRFRDKMANFMAGRYGMDEFGKFINILLFVMIIVSFFVRFLFLPTLLLLIYSYFRILSRNYPARNRENRWYLNATRMFRKNRSSYGNDAGTRQRDTAHRIFKCPNCRQKIRVPKGKGKICIRCPKCRIEFIKRT